MTQPAARRTAAASMRRLLERIFLGSIMTVIAVLLDRRLRRIFKKR